MDEKVCPRCKSSSLRKRNIKFLVNVCGHTLCETCVDLLFLKGSGACPICHVPLRRNHYRVQLFEDSMVEKEVNIRRRLLRDYNKKEEDFDTLDQYNDYLEEIEKIVYKLCNNIDVVDTNKRIEAYKRENRDLIVRNRTRMTREESELEELLEEERVRQKEREAELEQFEKAQKALIVQAKDEFIDQLMTSSGNANELMKQYVEKTKKMKKMEKALPAPKPVTEFSTGIKMLSKDKKFLPLPKQDDSMRYKYKAQKFITNGPAEPTLKEIQRIGYTKRMPAMTEYERAGGYNVALSCKRTLHDAFQALYCPVVTKPLL